MNYFPEYTVKYKTHLKSAVQVGLSRVFKAHPDHQLRTSADGRTGPKITLENPHTQADYPTVVIRYYGRRVERMGVGHEELIFVHDDDEVPVKMFHNIYEGDVELAVSALSSYDRDLMADTLVQTITMGSLEAWTNNLFDVIYPGYVYPLTDAAADGYPADGYPDSHWHYVTINTDRIQEFGETQVPTPWKSEDQVYNVSLRFGVLGEFYSVPPSGTVEGNEFIEQVTVYPWIKDLEDVPEGDPAITTEWQPPESDPA
jgi:hypothetical protein